MPTILTDATLFFLRPRASSRGTRRRGGMPAAAGAQAAAPTVSGRRASSRAALPPPSPARRLALLFVFLWFAASGAGHFLLTDMEVLALPAWVPLPRLMLLGTGAVELLGAVGLLYRPTRRAAGWALMVMTILITPAHYYVQQNPVLSDLPYWMLVARLPMQALLLVLIYWTTSHAARRRRGYRRV